MSRVSIERRMDRVRDAVLPPGSLAWRIDRLPDHLNRAYQMWRERCDAIILAHEKRGGNLYEAMLAGEQLTPPMPTAVERELWPNGKRHVILAEHTTAQAAAIYQAFLEETDG